MADKQDQSKAKELQPSDQKARSEDRRQDPQPKDKKKTSVYFTDWASI